MAYDGKVLRRATARYEDALNRRNMERRQRRERLSREVPRLREIERALRLSVLGAARAALSQGDENAVQLERVRAQNLALQEERAQILSERGLPFDYLSDAPACTKCGDTGFTGPRMCACLYAYYHEEQVRELSSTLHLNGSTFDDFNFDFYDEHLDEKHGISPRDNIDYIFDTCTDFARTFGRHHANLFMQGGTGLGKTFLSACIANAVIARGFSVVYETAVNLFSRFEDERFRRDDETARADVQRYLTCDLLILDDLGTEMQGNMTSASLYQLINTRLSAGRQCVISTNLTPAELRRRYTPQILSRLEGEYTDLLFFGEDIRLKKKRGAQ